jgi:hypothetical protein
MTHIEAYMTASNLVARLEITHQELRDRIIDCVAIAVCRHGADGASRYLDAIVEEQCKLRLDAIHKGEIP